MYIMATRSQNGSPIPKVLTNNPDSPNHPSELLGARAADPGTRDLEVGEDAPLLRGQGPPVSYGVNGNDKKDRDKITPPFPLFSRKKRNVIVCLLGVLLLAFVVLGFVLWRFVDKWKMPTGGNKQILVHAKHGAVATELDICSNLGVDILQEGGNAVDAAIASGICIGSINMFAAGIGGYILPTILSRDKS
jgi:Gamma-glutamyltranspeptidase